MKFNLKAMAVGAIALTLTSLIPGRGFAQTFEPEGSAPAHRYHSAPVFNPAQSSSRNVSSVDGPLGGDRLYGDLHAPRYCSDDLRASIDQIISHPTFRTAQWGIVIEALEQNTLLYSLNENHYFIPASNIKLLTTAAALQSLNFDRAEDLDAFHRWIYTTNRDSNNGYADALLRRLGGPQNVRYTLSSLGIDPYSYRQVDGSGLSRYNMAKPTTFMSVLKAMATASGKDIFYNSLPVGGYSGTLRNRFRGTQAQGIVRAKTGTLRGVRALSGYLEHPSQGNFAFSIMVNQPNQSGTTMLGAIDQIVLHMTQLEDCS